jgi:hypothetical protein
VDRIASPKLTEQAIIPAPEGFSAAAYAASVFQMFDGPALDITLKCENHMMDVIVDRFGEGVHTHIADAGHFFAEVRVSAGKTFYGWVFGMAGAIIIEGPDDAVREYLAMLDAAKSLQ